MANFVAADVTYSSLKIKKLDDGRKIVQATLAFGDGAKTYAAGGIPLSIGKLGCPTVIDSFAFDDAGIGGYVPQYDKVNKKLVLLQAPAQTHVHDILLKNAAVADGATTRVNAGANLLGANTGGDLTVTGGGANGGVVSKTLAAAALVEPSSVAIAAQTIKVTVIGF